MCTLASHSRFLGHCSWNLCQVGAAPKCIRMLKLPARAILCCEDLHFSRRMPQTLNSWSQCFMHSAIWRLSSTETLLENNASGTNSGATYHKWLASFLNAASATVLFRDVNLFSFSSKNWLSFWKNRFFFDYRILASLSRYAVCNAPCATACSDIGGRPRVLVSNLCLSSTSLPAADRYG